MLDSIITSIEKKIKENLEKRPNKTVPYEELHTYATLILAREVREFRKSFEDRFAKPYPGPH